MILSYNTKNIQLPEKKMELIDKKLSKLDRYLKPETKVIVRLSTLKGQDTAEITIFVESAVIRSEVTAQNSNILSALEAALGKIEGQIRKHKTKLERKYREEIFVEPEILPVADGEPLTEEERIADEEPKVVKTKRFALKPMSVEEATLQIELVEHSFFVFLNEDTGLVSVLYKRNDGDYGLIEPELM